MRLKKLFVIMLALCLSGSGQIFADGVCEEFTEFDTPYATLCFRMWSIPWIAFGNGWKTTVRGANLSDGSKMGKIQFTWGLNLATPVVYGGYTYKNLPALMTDNRTMPI